MLCNPVLRSFLLFYSHSWLKLTWQETRKPLRGLVVISVIASSTVKVALLWAAEQHRPSTAHPSEHRGERGAATCHRQRHRWPLLPVCERARFDASKHRGAPWRPGCRPLPVQRLTWVAAEAGPSLNTRLCSALSPFLLSLLCALQRRGGWRWTFYLQG